ncbi:Protein get1 [Lachnellula cervina]|uniref:Protein get1 n=1 Tax=Lachnellula cervina TaxID=1316786 RepID=A0A7D8YS09_9HELO|nr:Protein get1 [Lachnellula cervina]
MPSLLVVVFILQLTIHLVNTVGAATINNILWNIYNRLPTPTSKAAAEQRDLKKQFLKVRTELNATSSQDNFAKWAKLRRQHDKLVEQVEANKKLLDGTKSTFDSAISALRWVGTNGLRMLIQFWFQKQPMFWIPKGWVPYYAEWLLSFPRAPVGSISIQVWALACGAIILLISDALGAVVGLATGTGKATQDEKNNSGQPMKMEGEKVTAESRTSPEAKKEL